MAPAACMNPATLDRLEFPQLKDLLRARLTSAPGRRALERLAPSADRAWIAAELERVGEVRAFLAQEGELGFGGLADPAPLIEKLGGSEVVLSPEELLDLCTRRRILPGGELDDHASPELAELRSEIQRTESQLHRTLRRVREQAAQHAALPDVLFTPCRGRPPRPTARPPARGPPGGVPPPPPGPAHTLFLEPLETIALNNELVRLREEEAMEIRRILRGLTERLAARKAALGQAAGILGELDSLFARARYARDFRCTLPALNSDQALTLTAIRHPLLEAALKSRFSPAASAAGGELSPRAEARGLNRDEGREERNGEVVPISLRLDSHHHVLVISGPTAGGKTAALKTLGLAALAAQAGTPVPAEEAVLPVFDHILADIGDEQSLVENLSPFSAHILNLRAMAEEAGAQ